ncbi:Putative formate dehydrogenase [bacterium HR26]|nr:Putative formate dehydrogenase [bacterium HR26]
MIEAIESGQIRAMYVAGSSHEFASPVEPRLLAALEKLEFLVVEDCFPSALTERAHVVLPAAMFMEKDGTFTNADRTVQRVRLAIDPPGDARPSWWFIQEIARRLGYQLALTHPSLVLQEVTHLTPIYRGIIFPRLERGPLTWPVHGLAGPAEGAVRLGASVPGGGWAIWMEQAFGGVEGALQIGDGLSRERVRFVMTNQDTRTDEER